MPDSELVLGIIEGRIDFAVLMQRHERRVYKVLYTLVRNAADAEELTQCVFVQAFEELKSFSSKRGSLGTWLYRIAYNLAMSYFRKRKREPVSLDAMPESYAPAVDGPADLYEARMLRERTQQSVGRLSPLLRRVLDAYHARDLSLSEVAAELGCSERHVRYLCLVAIRKLRGMV